MYEEILQIYFRSRNRMFNGRMAGHKKKMIEYEKKVNQKCVIK
jgi:hypothetical protein